MAEANHPPMTEKDIKCGGECQIYQLPFIAVTKILSFLPWEDKLSVVRALPVWNDNLHTVEAWHMVQYDRELDENIYFIKDKRWRFVLCIKKYGKWFRWVKLVFGCKIGHIGLKILHAISEFCPKILTFYVAQEMRDQTDMGYFWKKNVILEVSRIITSLADLRHCYIVQPSVDWEDNVDNNIIKCFIKNELTTKVTHLELTSLSLFNHEGLLHVLTNFTKLRCLVVNREKVNNSILLSLVDAGLQELTLVQEEEVSLEQQQDLRDDFWTKVMDTCPLFHLDLVFRCVMVLKDLFTPKMPLRVLVLDDLVNIVTKGVLDHIITCYKNSLIRFHYSNFLLENLEEGDRRLPRALVNMAETCTRLKFLQYGFPLSSTTVLLIAQSRKLQKFVVPSVEITYEFDWPEEVFTQDEITRLKQQGRSQRSLENAVSTLLGYSWTLYDAEESTVEEHLSQRILL
ncbi:hypothetical protein FSP39_005603 [Pinctada imbricata]|uniref:F-box domain-containing protein n=1 Tax=Pinctada imbricata TaxID=66713 RepID=A0AA88YUR0_PINIB|nr:hypothetical protein FSP39_005603 [Pinctada imbricata]